MAEKRQFELLLVRLVPHALRDDFMTVGVVVVEKEENRRPAVGGRQEHQGPGFADVRFTRDWKRVGCFAPEIEVEMLERLEAELRAGLGGIRGREDLLRMVEERFGALFDVGPVKALVAADPAAEMRVLERDYLEPWRAGTPTPEERPRHTGRLGIVSRMEDAFREAGVLELLQRDLEMKEFTGENDPFRVDFGFRVRNHSSKPTSGFHPRTASSATLGTPGSPGTPGETLKMFQGLALNLSREPAVTLAYRFARIQSGMRSRGEEALMTAIIHDEAMRARGEVGSGIAMLRANGVEVQAVEDMSGIAENVRREIMA